MLTTTITKIGFNALMLPNQLKLRGVIDTPLQYPYRDDAYTLWNATKAFMTEYVNLFYTNDASVQNDAALQTWSKTLAADNGGRVKGFGEDDVTGIISTKNYLIDVLTMIQFTAGVQHAALNFPQASIMSYSPMVPFAGYKDISDANIDSFVVVTEMLEPPYSSAFQIQVGPVLGGVYYTTYGNYGNSLSKEAKPAVTSFQNSLNQIQTQIQTRENTAKFSYTYLLPSNIPLSINI